METHFEKFNTATAVLMRGVAGIGMVTVVPDWTPDNIAKIGQLVIQLLIGVVTLVGILRKSGQPSITVAGKKAAEGTAQETEGASNE